MDQALRNKLRSVVTQCRRLLEESIAQQLQGKYDIYATGTKDEVKAENDVPLGHLTDEERQARQEILAHFKHIDSLVHKPRETLEQLIREIAFTHLNRLCAYKMMEVRDVYVGGQRFREAVSKGLKSQGFLFYLADHPDDEQRYNAGDQEGAYRRFLNWLGGTLSQEIGVLFSPTDPANRIYPPQRVLDEVLELLNSEELRGIWSEDETIGWVYQYFTPKELRDQARKESQAPRNSYELAFRNQFFTPRYVVEFLSDNTLGRIWYEMMKGDTRLKDQCRYMVRRPGEVFFSEKEDEPGSPLRAMRELLLGGTEGTFPEFKVGDIQPLIELAHTVDGYERHPIENASDPNWWPWATTRQIEESEDLSGFSTLDLLDVLFIHVRGHYLTGGYGDLEPVCYRIGNEVCRRCLEGRQEDASQEQLLRAITAIPNRRKKDPREIKILDPACGSGHFLLYCFALLLVIYEEAYDDPELGPALQADYPTRDDLRRALPGLILRYNLHGIDIDLRCTQIAALALWLRCQRAYQEMGFKKERPRITRSNIVCAEPMPGEKDMLKEFVAQLEPKLLGQLVDVVFDKMKLAGEAGSLLRIEEEIRDAVSEAGRQWRVGPITKQMLLFGEFEEGDRQERFDFSGITDEQFFEQAETKVVKALRAFAEQARVGDRLQRLLFSEDAERGFAFVELCYKPFDVVLMNPPFGDPSHLSRKSLESQYSHLSNEVAIAFVQRSNELLIQGGYGGVLSPRNPLFLDSLSKFRREYYFDRTPLNLLVDSGFGVLDDAMIETSCIVYSKGGRPHTSWVCRLLEIAPAVKAEELSTQCTNSLSVYICKLDSLDSIPNRAFAYWATPRLLRILRTHNPLESIADGKWGLFTADNDRFLRLWWETSQRPGWVPYYKGGSFRRFVYDSESVVNWSDGGAAIKGNVDSKGRQRSRIPNSEFYFRPGLTFPNVTFKGLAVRAFPQGAIFSLRGPAIFPHDKADSEWLLGFLNTRSAEVFVVMQAATRRWELAQVGRIPIPEIGLTDRTKLARVARECCAVAQAERSWDETSRYFLGIPSLKGGESLVALTQAMSQIRALLEEKLAALLNTIEVMAEGLYGLEDKDIECLQRFTGETKAVEIDDDGVEEADEYEEDYYHVDRMTRRVVSFLVGVSMGRWATGFLREQRVPPEPLDPFSALPDPPAFHSNGESEPTEPNCMALPPTMMVDDFDHSDDIIRRVRDVLEVIWNDRADAIEKEACEILGVTDLRDYFRKPGAGGFWDDHVKRYSKSRRKAPIYWLLQSSRKNYALWVYYHRLDKDILFKALLNYVEPKIRREESRLGELRSQTAALGAAAKGTKKLDKDIDRQEAFLTELRDFEEKLRRAANLHLDFDLNDGVVLNIAPLRELVPWKEAKSYWDDLMDGKYEWSSIGKQLREKGLVK
jgi:hypothetical protein